MGEAWGGIRWAKAAVTRNPNNLTPHSLTRAEPRPHDTLTHRPLSLQYAARYQRAPV